MKKHGRTIAVAVLFVLSILLAVSAPYLPSVLFSVITEKYDYHFATIRHWAVIPAFELGSVLLSAWGIALLHKK